MQAKTHQCVTCVSAVAVDVFAAAVSWIRNVATTDASNSITVALGASCSVVAVAATGTKLSIVMLLLLLLFVSTPMIELLRVFIVVVKKYVLCECL